MVLEHLKFLVSSNKTAENSREWENFGGAPLQSHEHTEKKKKGNTSFFIIIKNMDSHCFLVLLGAHYSVGLCLSFFVSFFLCLFLLPCYDDDERTRKKNRISEKNPRGRKCKPSNTHLPAPNQSFGPELSFPDMLDVVPGCDPPCVRPLTH
jgi:hypothetical protein